MPLSGAASAEGSFASVANSINGSADLDAIAGLSMQARATVPLAGEGTSTTALAVSTDSIGASTSMWSPTCHVPAHDLGLG